MKQTFWEKTTFVNLMMLTSFFAFNCSDNKASTQDRDAQLLAALASRTSTQATATTATASISCTTANPAFSTLRDAGFNTSCGRSGCHDGTTRYNTTNINQVKAYVTSGQPTSSTLYTIQNGGSMAVYTNATLSQAIFCWIQGGANN